jgi:hypothetical protein
MDESMSNTNVVGATFLDTFPKLISRIFEPKYNKETRWMLVYRAIMQVSRLNSIEAY